jgi:hypothetical protein
MKPDCGCASDFNHTSSFAIPIRNNHFIPASPGVVQYLFQCRQALACLARSAHCPRFTFGSRSIQGRIQPKSGDQTDRIGKFGHSPLKIDGCKTGIHHQDQFSHRQPASYLKKHLQGPVSQLLVSSFALLVVTLGRSQNRQEGQRTDSLLPWNGCQQHQAQPAQAIGFDKMTVAGAHRIPAPALTAGASVNALGLDLRSPATLNRIVQPHHHRPPNGKRSHQQTQEQSTGFTTRPDRSVEHPVKILKMLFGAQTHNAQYSGHRPLSRSENGSQQQDLRVLPNTPGIEHCKSREDCGIFDWQGRLGPFSRQSKMTIAYLAPC